MSTVKNIELRPVGFVKTKAIGKEVKEKNHISEIVLHKELLEALDGIGDFSHLFVIFFMNELSNEKRMIMKVHPRGREDMPLLGVFATRTSHRPNPIGLTIVELLKVESNVLTIRGLDAFNGTPILDIKPLDYRDFTEAAKVPNWWIRLEKEK